MKEIKKKTRKITVKKTVRAKKTQTQAIPAKSRIKHAREHKQSWFGLHSLKAPAGAHKPRKLLGRGPSSGHGKTSTRGSKGQTSRTGHDYYLGFEGGQTPLIRRMPKRGFVNEFKKIYQIVNLKDLQKITEETITPAILEAAGLIKNRNKLVKILGEGAVKKSYFIRAHAFSQKAVTAIKEAGGTTEIIRLGQE